MNLTFISEEKAENVGRISGNYLNMDAITSSYLEKGWWDVKVVQTAQRVRRFEAVYYPDNVEGNIENKIAYSRMILNNIISNAYTPSTIGFNSQYAPYYRIPLAQNEEGKKRWFLTQFDTSPMFGFYVYQSISDYNDEEHDNYSIYPNIGNGFDNSWYNERKFYYTEQETEVPIYDPVEKIAMCSMVYDGKQYIGLNILTINIQRGNFTIIGFSYEDIGIPDIVETSEEYGDYSDEGGYDVGGFPSFDDTSISIGIPDDPSISVSNLGFLNTYKVSSSGLEGMLNELFPDEPLPIIPQPTEGGFLSDIAYSINALSSTVGNLFTSFINSNLMQYVVDVHVVPVSPQIVGSENVKIGFKTLETTAQKVVHDYVTIDCGTLHIDEFRKNFTDFTLCKYQLYIPFVGVVPIQPSLFLGSNGAINVTFKMNIIDGSFTAFVSCTSSKSKLKNSVVGQYSGNCCVHIPITSNSYSNIVSGLVTGVSNTVSMAEGSKTSMSQGVNEIASATNTILSQPTYNMSNGFNATSSFMGVRKPYFIISRPTQSFSEEYPHEKGLPLNAKKKLSTLVGTGFTQCDKPHIDGIKCSEKERSMIYNLLTSGVIL